jgi:hypothetical protein
MDGMTRSGTTNVPFVTTRNVAKVKLWLNSAFERKVYEIKSGFFGAILHRQMKFGTMRDSQTPQNLTPESGMGVNFFFEVGSGSRLGLLFEQLIIRLIE